MAAIAEVARRPASRPGADGLLSYVRGHREIIGYLEFQFKGWQIGIGPTEATCKTLTARLKVPACAGMPTTLKPSCLRRR